MSSRLDVIILGRKFGTSLGWDAAVDYEQLAFYDFEPALGVDLPAGDLSIDFHEGHYSVDDVDGTTLVSGDLAKFCLGIPQTLAPPDAEAGETAPSSDDDLSVD